MHLKSKLLENWRAKAIAAITIAILGLCVWISPFTSGLERLSFDLPLILRPDIHPTEAILVFMDDNSRMRLHQPVQGPWDRAMHVRLLNELFARHARAVVFDVLFDESWSNHSVDEQFALAMNSHGHVVLGASCRYSGEKGEEVVGQLQHPVEPLASAAEWGVAEFFVDPDEVIRRHYYDGNYTNLAWQAAIAAGAKLTNWSAPRWMNYYGPRGTIPHASYYQFFEPGVLGDQVVSNKVVFVGMAPLITYQGSRSSDTYRTSYSRWTGAEVPGVEIQATACLNLLRGDWLVRLPLAAELSLVVIIFPVIGFLLPVFRLRWSLIIGICSSLVVAIAAVVLVQRAHVWFSWSVLSFVQIPLAIVGAFFVASYRPKKADLQILTKGGGIPLAVGDVVPEIPDHIMLHSLGHGSYGEVWLARSALGPYRAVKLVFRNRFKNDGPFTREFRGIQAFEQLSRSHDGFVDILHVGLNNSIGYFYYIMELADDETRGIHIDPKTYSPQTLENELKRRGRLPCEETVRIGLVLSSALHELHRAGLVHRDIKPSNIIFVGGVPKLADIGLVTRVVDAKSRVGTPGYMPDDDPGTPKADIFGLGMVLYELLTGQAFPGMPDPPVGEAELAVFQSLNKIILKACEPKAGRRYKSAEDMHDQLKRLAAKFWKDKTLAK